MAQGFGLFAQMLAGKAIEVGGSFLASTAGQAAIATAFSAGSTISAGNAARGEANYRAQLAGISAQGKEIERRRRLIQSLSTQVSGRGASGITLQGTPLVTLQETINQSELDRLTIASNLSATRSLLSVSGSNAALRGRINAGATILDSISDIRNRG